MKTAIAPLDKDKKQDTLSSSIYDKMRQDILDGQLKAGEKLGMHALQKRYAVGNSPIREALSRLLPEGLVEREDQKGFKVQILSKADLAEITQMRCWLEDIAIREAIRLGDTQWEESIVIAHHRLSREPHGDPADKSSNPKWVQYHEDFHLALLSACQSKWLMLYCRNLLALMERYRRNDLVVNYNQRDAREEHTDIMNAAIERDADTASKLLQDHYRLTCDSIMASLPDD
jgi:GntR family transcriptional regulator, carbon starvation induced regulator